MNILLIAAGPGRVGIFATADPTGLRLEVTQAVDVQQHLTIACTKAHDVERDVRRKFSDLALGMDAKWYGISFAAAVAAIALSMQQLGADDLVVRGVIKPKLRCKLMVPA